MVTPNREPFRNYRDIIGRYLPRSLHSYYILSIVLVPALGCLLKAFDLCAPHRLKKLSLHFSFGFRALCHLQGLGPEKRKC